ncbi:MAG: hypothetical protein QNJ18_05035 [Xenococcaceae cyanobacterium MO_167.B52]|nr:hypothetical protein [Xenococcaceae cyanobacterium MO_167.B52]
MSTPIPCDALATKAELNELKQQINELFGRLEDDETQVKDVLTEGNLQGTLFLGSFIAGIDDIVEKVKPRVNLGAKTKTNFLFKNGNGKYFKSGTVNQLNKLIQANSAQATAALKNSAINASRITGLLSFLLPVLNYTLIQVQTRKLNPLILENIDRQIATDQVNWDLTMRVFNYQRDLTEQEIGQLKADFLDNLANQKIINDENQLTNSQLFQQIDERDILIANLKFQIEELKRILEEQKEENLAIAEEFGLFAGEAQERIRELEDINFTQNERIEALETQLGELEKQLNDSELDLLDSRESLTEWELFTGTKGTDLTNLQFEFANFDLQNAPEIERENKVNETRARFTTIYDYSLNNPSTGGSSGGGGFPQSARDSLTTTQNKQIELTAKLAGIDPTTITGFPVPDYQVTRFDNPFSTIIDSLLPQITPPDTTDTGDTADVNLEEFSNNFDNKFEAIAATLAGLTATVNNIDLNTNPTNLSTTVGNAVCSTTAPTGCMTQNVTNPLIQGQQGISNKLNDIASTLSAAFGAGNAISNQAIFDVVTATNNIVSKGWASTAIDKTLNAANFALSLHNAMMLSTNIAETILDVLTVISIWDFRFGIWDFPLLKRRGLQILDLGFWINDFMI